MNWVILLCIVLIIAIFVVIVVYLVYRVWIRKLEEAYMLSQQQYCQDLSDPTYREEVFIPENPAVYSKNLAIALFDVCSATTKYNCRIYGRDIDIVADHPPGLPEVSILTGVDPGDGQTVAIAIGYYNPDTQIGVLAFGSTFTLGQWKDNFTYRQVSPTKLAGATNDMLVHAGFYGLYTAVQDKVREWVRNRSFQGLFVTGHSLGGSLAEIGSFDVKEYLDTIDVSVDKYIVYVFGAPRPGNVPFSQGIEVAVPQLQRIANVEDDVMTLPPAVFDGLIYKHPNRMVPFNVNLGTVEANHVQAYRDYLPETGC